MIASARASLLDIFKLVMTEREQWTGVIKL